MQKTILVTGGAGFVGHHCVEHLLKNTGWKIVDLVEVIAPKARRKIIGIRPGEKLHEILLTEEEARHAKEFDKYFVIEPEFPFWKKDNFKNGNLLPKEFKYTSDTNKKWITKEQMKKILKDLELENEK